MFEIAVCCVIIFAFGYWATLWAMGRRDDVLHGQLAEVDSSSEAASEPRSPASPAPAALLPANAEGLQSLLVSIKRELKDAAQS